MDRAERLFEMKSELNPEGEADGVKPNEEEDTEELGLPEEYADLGNTLDQLDTCLNKLEEKNDGLYARMQQLLEDNRQTRKELEAERLAGSQSESSSSTEDRDIRDA